MTRWWSSTRADGGAAVQRGAGAHLRPCAPTCCWAVRWTCCCRRARATACATWPSSRTRGGLAAHGRTARHPRPARRRQPVRRRGVDLAPGGRGAHHLHRHRARRHRAAARRAGAACERGALPRPGVGGAGGHLPGRRRRAPGVRERPLVPDGGMSPDEACGDGWQRALHAADRARVQLAWAGRSLAPRLRDDSACCAPTAAKAGSSATRCRTRASTARWTASSAP